MTKGPRDVHAVPLGGTREMAHEFGLPDARLALDDDHRGRTAAHALQQLSAKSTFDLSAQKVVRAM